MKDHSTDQVTFPELLVALQEVVAAHRPAFGQERPYQRMVALLLGQLFCFGRHTVTQMLLALGLTDADWTAWYRLFSCKRFLEEQLAACFFQLTLAHVPVEEPYVVGVDATQIPRSSEKMPGTGWLRALCTPVWRSGIHRAQRFVIGQWLIPLVEGFSRAVPLRCLAAFTAKAVPAGVPPQKEWEAGLSFLIWVRAQLDRAGREDQCILAMGDGAYDCLALWRLLPERVVFIARTACNRVLRLLPTVSEGRGRPCKYGPRAPRPDAWIKPGVKEGWHRIEVCVRGHLRRMCYRVEGPYLREGAPERPVFLLVVRGQVWYSDKARKRRHYREPCYYLVSAVQRAGEWCLPYSAEMLLTWTWHRWELEVAHREMKSGLGVGEMQCWNPRSTVTSVQWSVWVYAVLVLAGYRAWGLLGGPQAPARWWRGARRWSLNTLWRGYRSALWGSGEFRALWTGTEANWPKKEARLMGLWNAVAGAARA